MTRERHEKLPEQRPQEEALDALLDEALRATAQPAGGVDLREHVLAAIEGRERAPQLSSRGAAWRRPAAALAGAMVILFVMFLAWPRHDRGSDRAAGNEIAAPAGVMPAQPAGQAAGPTPGSVAGEAGRAAAAPPTTARASGGRTRRASSAEAVGPEETSTPVEAYAGGPHLPGAPAGQLGDPLQPLPLPPPIAIAPIAQAPIASALPLSDIARPVTEFPSENELPEAQPRSSGPTGGNRR